VHDLISHYRIADTEFSKADEDACVSGQTSDGTPIRGCGTLDVMLPPGQDNAPSVADGRRIPRNPGARATRPFESGSLPVSRQSGWDRLGR
jgi:hypothetical protein